MPLTQNILQAARNSNGSSSFRRKNRWKNELTGQEGRWHVDESPMQRAVKNAILEAGINDLYPCSKPRIWRRGKSARQNLDFYKYPCKICANSQKMIYNKEIRKNCKDFTPTFFTV